MFVRLSPLALLYVIVMFSYTISAMIRRSVLTRSSSIPLKASMALFSSVIPFPNLSIPSPLTEVERKRAYDCTNFLDASPDPFHVVSYVTKNLTSAGFVELKEDTFWTSTDMKPQSKFFFTRGGSSIVAFTIGSKFKASGNECFKILGAHTDSPNLKIKPKSKRSPASGVILLNVECYGGGLWHTWFDRDLSISGRVIVKDGDGFTGKLVKIDHPILRIPNLCIHLRSQEEREAFKVNKEDHLQPVLCGEITKQLNGDNDSNATSINKTNNEVVDAWKEAQEPILLSLLAHELQVKAEDIVDFELSVYDTQPASRSGVFSEFLCSSRIDNLASCYAITEAFLDHSSSPEGLENDEDISIMALFDHEEVGSDSTAGAGSNLIQDAIERISGALYTNNNREQAKILAARSFIMSIDMAHAVHPNYASKHEKNHSPLMNKGIVIKSNVNQRYATNGMTGFLTREIGRRAGVPVQEFAVRNDCPCGSTIGPM